MNTMTLESTDRILTRRARSGSGLSGHLDEHGALDIPDGDHPEWRAFPISGTYAQGVAWIIGTLAGAVAYAHAREIHHRDIKPANVLLTLHHGPQLLDFNLAYDPHAAEQAEAALRGGTRSAPAPTFTRSAW